MTPLNRPLRVLHVVLSGQFAGAERYCADLANRQAEVGHEVHVLGRARAPVLAALSRRVQSHALPIPLLHAWSIRRLVSRYRIDVAHAHLSHACKALAGVRGEVARAGTLHVGYKAHQHGHLDALVCVNPLQLEQLRDFKGVSAVVPNWLPSLLPNAAPQATSWRTRLGLGPDTKVVGSVGRLHASKGMDVLIRAFRQVAPADSALVIVGEGPCRGDLERLRAGDPRIHLVGHQADVAGWLSSMDLFVSSSREETFGLAILEAMQQGLPVLASATEGPSQYLRSQPVPLLPPGEVMPLAQALKGWFLQSSQACPRQVQYDLQDFDPGLALRRMDVLYADALVATQSACWAMAA